MSVSVEESVAQLLKLIDPQGFTAEQFCDAIRDQPLFSGRTAEDIAQEYLTLAQNGQLAVFAAGTEDADGNFTPFDIPWIYDARSDSVSGNSVDVLRQHFPHGDMTNRHWGYAAERRIEAGEYPGKTMPEVLYSWLVALRKKKLNIEFKNVVPKNPYDSEIIVTILKDDNEVASA